VRVAIVTENFLPKIDGVTRTLSKVLEHLRTSGHRAIVLGPTGAPRRYAGARVFAAPGMPIPFYPELHLLLPPPSFARCFERFRPDVVHVVDPMVLGAAGIVWAQRLGIPIVSSYHTNLAAYCTYFHLSALVRPLWRYRQALHNACEVTLCPSPSTAQMLTTQGFERVSVWTRGVDIATFDPSRRSVAWRAEVTGDPDRQILLYVGRLSHEKNLTVLVDAFRKLAAQRDGKAPPHLVLVGDGPARGDLEQALARLPVTFTGYLRGDELARAYASADVFAFPSLTETFGQVMLEAMASGLPVVAFTAEGTRDLIAHEHTGLLVPDRNPTAFADALQRLLDSPNLRARLSTDGHMLAGERSWSAAMTSLMSAYQCVSLSRRAA
jgi:glycosyltransferase involved in cell wall biosynthesis